MYAAPMKTANSIDALRKARAKLKGSIGFVPTMGALHEGHVSLMRRSAKENKHTIVSIFVNPSQFGPSEDLAKYPRTLKDDLAFCKKAGVDLVFTPTSEMIYPKGYDTWVEVSELSKPMCGEFRPGHFKGVATVVCKLFNLVQPTRAYFGRKDAQQLAVLTRMVADLNMSLEVVPCETVREPDGLAMSSRNRYLSASERERALCISRALFEVQRRYERGERDVSHLTSVMESALGAEMDEVQYADVRRLADLTEFGDKIDAPALAAVAGYVGSTRLIDNVVLGDQRKTQNAKRKK
jgi:pantoate--beta-alanine ligase